MSDGYWTIDQIKNKILYPWTKTTSSKAPVCWRINCYKIEAKATYIFNYIVIKILNFKIE